VLPAQPLPQPNFHPSTPPVCEFASTATFQSWLDDFQLIQKLAFQVHEHVPTKHLSVSPLPIFGSSQSWLLDSSSDARSSQQQGQQVVHVWTTTYRCHAQKRFPRVYRPKPANVSRRLRPNGTRVAQVKLTEQPVSNALGCKFYFTVKTYASTSIADDGYAYPAHICIILV
jgi:hypothetical protein